MAKKKEKNIENKEVEVINEVVTDNLEEVKEEVVVEEPKDPKQIIMEDFISFYNASVRGKSHVSGEVGRQIVDFFNQYTDSRVVYKPCGSCVNSKITYMLKMAKQKYNIQL